MKKLKFPGFALIIGLILTGGCGQQNNNSVSGDKLQGTISISGAFALYPLTAKWAEEFQKSYPNVRIDISAGGAGKGMADALSGMVDLGMFSRGVTEAEKAKGCWWIAVTKDAVLPTVNNANPWIDQIMRSGITKDQFEKIFVTGEIEKWNQLFRNGEDKKINVYTRSDACGAAQMWGEYLGKDQESLKGIGVFGDPGMADAIKNDTYGIGYNNVIYVYDLKTRKCYDKLESVPIDLNADGVINPEENFYSTIDEITVATKSGIYPSPPARDLYFVSKGTPGNPAATEFLKWILTEGQKFVEEAGYVQLDQEKINQELAKITP